ncbi:hypothetical protein CLOM_g17656 [Closterium sp. NIES-68]|nr:hypothetical protein CLOM_g17656 [Closterium sp. NIES-68]
MEILDYLLEKGFVRPSTSPFTAPIMFTPKKDGGLRMCIDYRALNRVTIKSPYPISHADELIDQLREAKFFSKIDMQGSYHQIRVNKTSCYKTAFRTRYGSYEYTVMPFGLTNAPSTFQLTMNEAFRPLLDKCVIVYLDDILVYSTTREQHLKDLTVFSGVRRFIPNMAGLTSPLADILKKAKFYEWGGEQQAAFEQLEIFLNTLPVLRIADPHRPFKLNTDTSDLAVGTVLLQDFEEGLQPIAYEHPQLTVKQGAYYLKSGTNQIWVPAYHTLRELLIQEAHDSNFSGHYGIDKTAKLLSRNYYWPDVPKGVQLYVTSCTTCQRMMSSRLRPNGLLQPLEPPSRPWQQVTMDFVTGLPAGPSSNDAILIVVDRLTKMAHFAACKTTITAEQTAKLFLTNMVRLHGFPSAIISDRDPRFTSNFWTKNWQQYDTRLHLSTAYHPQSDGQTERTNQTME